MDILPLIKRSSVIRKYKLGKVPDNHLKKIIQAGRWSLSVHGFQPWSFVVIKNKIVINKIADIAEKKAANLFAGLNLILKSTAGTIRNASILIIIYNDSRIVNYAKRLGNPYTTYAKIVEIQCIGAVIQNMFLEANSLGLGAAWLCAPLFCAKAINNLLGEEKELIALLSLGRPHKSALRRTKRKSYDGLIRLANEER